MKYLFIENSTFPIDAMNIITWQFDPMITPILDKKFFFSL